MHGLDSSTDLQWRHPPSVLVLGGIVVTHDIVGCHECAFVASVARAGGWKHVVHKSWLAGQVDLVWITQSRTIGIIYRKNIIEIIRITGWTLHAVTAPTFRTTGGIPW